MFREIGPNGGMDLKDSLHPTSERDAVLSFPSPGTYVLAFQSSPAYSNLPSIRYNDYIKVEGLTPSIQARAQSHTSDTPGREVYSRRCKVLIQVGGQTAKSQNQVTAPIGMSLEIVPERNPYTLPAGEPLPVRILFEGRPLAGALVKLTNLEFDGRPVAMRLTDAAGRAAFIMPRTGDWLINVIWTKPVKGNRDADFDTTFSSLTFGFPKQVSSANQR